MRYKRPIAVLALVLLVLFAPYWAYLPALVLCIIYFEVFWEGVLVGFLIDALYAPSGDILRSHAIAFIALILTLAMIPLRERLRFE